MIYDHPQGQAEGASKGVNTWVEVSGPLDSEDKTKVRIGYNYLMGKSSHGSETQKWFYLWSTMQAGSHAAIQIKQFLAFYLKLSRLQLFKENKFIILSLPRKGGKLRVYGPSGE